MDERVAKQKVVEAGIRLVESGLIARTWGNVSCRISDSHFVISPSGRDYLSLTPDEIVTVAIADVSYTGNIKPSSEKGVHAEIYKHSPETNFIMHTHQENASVISAAGQGSIHVNGSWPLLGKEIIIASYGLPGTKKLRKGIADALLRSTGHAIIMKNHGAVCFGEDETQTFQIASDLEAACIEFVEDKFMKMQGVKSFHADHMRQYALSQITGKQAAKSGDAPGFYGNSERTAVGFMFHTRDGKTVDVVLGRPDSTLPAQAKIHDEIYRRYAGITSILQQDDPDVLAVSRAGITLYPFVDDFAQIVGTKVKTVPPDPEKIADALKHASAVLVENNGALCCGASQGDASAVQMIIEKNAKALICGTLFGKVKPLSKLDCSLMRFVYLRKYSKQISKNK